MSLPSLPTRADTTLHTSSPAIDELRIDSFSYEPRSVLTAALDRELTRCACWLLDRRATSASALELRFELQLGGIVELYAGLLETGLELTRGSHMGLTAMCTSHKFGSRGSGSVITVQLAVRLLDELTVGSVLSTGTAFA